jgi:hypothetical protein
LKSTKQAAGTVVEALDKGKGYVAHIGSKMEL